MQESPQVQAIRARYVASFPEKTKLISDCISIANRKTALDSDFEEIKQHLHKLAGSSGMYGYQDICDLARAGMASIDDGDSQSLLEGLNKLHDLLQTQA